MNCTKCKYYDSSVNTCNGDAICSGEYEEFKDKIDKYRWHDLRKNPDDLPKEDGFYIACVEHPKNHTRRTREIKFSIIRLNSIAFWERNNIFVNNESVIAWREIEPFEEEVEE